ncbi:MAG: sodium:solute symporter [Flavobacteriales bacterium]|nr:MAG: sodium:solute symporter [Flavobacteriales bacterium]
MTTLDWFVMLGTLASIVIYGVYVSLRSSSGEGFLRGSDQSWFTMGVSVMATQASAITFLSAPGLGYESGLRFVQFYFGLPLAIVVVCAFFVPMYYRMNVYTAYEYLEKRFDLRMRLFTASLFLLQRGLAAGITIFAPAIILSTILGWDLRLTNILVGSLVIVYTLSGGTKAVSITQKYQMGVILLGLVFSGVLLYREIAPHMSFLDTLFFAGEMGRMQVLDFSFSATERYTVWSGLTGGFFLSLSYFGTDQSQVQRYLGGKSVDESRAGLLFNAVLKIPMQFSILFIGVLVFVFFTIERPPLHFNQAAVAKLSPEAAAKVADLESDFTKVHADIQLSRENWLSDRSRTTELKKSMMAEQLLRQEVVDIIELEQVKAKDTNYVFLYFVLEHLPKGVVGLIIAMILSAAMSSTAGELNALTTTTVVDYHRRLGGGGAPMTVNRLYTLFWGVLAIIFALSASLFDNLIEMVNLLGSLFYGTILGVFLVAFFLKKVKAKAVFSAALASQVSVLVIHSLTYLEWISGVGYLWYNLIGCVMVVSLSTLQQSTHRNGE